MEKNEGKARKVANFFISIKNAKEEKGEESLKKVYFSKMNFLSLKVGMDNQTRK